MESPADISLGQPCPGLEQEDFPESVACRLLTRADGSVVQQTITPVSLCTEEHFTSLKQRIGGWWVVSDYWSLYSSNSLSPS